MIAGGRETWILIAIVVLAVAALVVSAAGWVLLVRGRRDRRSAAATVPGDEP